MVLTPTQQRCPPAGIRVRLPVMLRSYGSSRLPLHLGALFVVLDGHGALFEVSALSSTKSNEG